MWAELLTDEETMNRRPDWYNRFFTGLYSRVLGSQFSPEASLAHARIVKRLLRARKGQRVLDVPCGKGRLTIPLARLGLCMTGVDLTASYVRTARRLAAGERLSVGFMQSDMRDIAFVGEFHGVFNWFGSFGYFTDEDNLLFCRKVYQALRPGGRFLIEGPNKSWIRTHFVSHAEHTIAGTRIVTRNGWDPKRRRVVGRWTFSRGGRRETKRTDMRIFDGAEIRQVLMAAGFRHIQLYGWPPVGRLTRHSRRMIAVAVKPWPGQDAHD